MRNLKRVTSNMALKDLIRINNECSIIDYHASDFISIFQLQMMVSRGMIQSNLEI